MKKEILIFFTTFIFSAFVVFQALAAGPKVSEVGNKHNLSALGRELNTTNVIPNTSAYRATNDTSGNASGQQICIFCHTPHNANVLEGAPLWNRDFSSASFSRYTSATLRIRIDDTAKTASGYTAAWQPDGSSKLCLSCHDGVASLGNVLRGGPITMISGKEVITGFASFADPNKMKTGHHPVSFVYNSAVVTAINAGKSGYQLPSAATPQALADSIKLDRNGKMQCTTCHDAHQNKSKDTDPNATYDGTRKIAPFWVYGAANDGTTDHDSVCTACHPLTTPAPW